MLCCVILKKLMLYYYCSSRVPRSAGAAEVHSFKVPEPQEHPDFHSLKVAQYITWKAIKFSRQELSNPQLLKSTTPSGWRVNEVYQLSSGVKTETIFFLSLVKREILPEIKFITQPKPVPTLNTPCISVMRIQYSISTVQKQGMWTQHNIWSNLWGS